MVTKMREDAKKPKPGQGGNLKIDNKRKLLPLLHRDVKE